MPTSTATTTATTLLLLQRYYCYSAQQKYDNELFKYNVGEVDKYETSEYQLAWQNNINLDYGSLVLLYDFLKEEIDTTQPYDKSKRTNNGFVVGYNIQHENITITVRWMPSHLLTK